MTDVAAPAPAQAPAPAHAAEPGLYRRLVWLTLFRILVVTVFLGGAALAGLRGGEEVLEALTPFYGVVVVSYAAVLVSSILLLRRRALVATAWAHVAVDVGAAAVVVGYTGGIESVFVFLYSLAIGSGAILLHARGAVVAAVVAILTHLTASLLLAQPRGDPRIFTLLTQSAALAGTAALASYLTTQLRRAGETLAARETDLAVITALHETIVQSMTSGLLTLDPAGRVTFLNRAGEVMLGVPAARARGRLSAELFPAFEAETGRGELEYENGRGERLRLGYSSFPLLVEAGATVGTAVIFQDLTRLRSMEEAVQRSARLADLGRVAAGLAHELRNPLASMSGSLELLATTGATEEDRRLMGIVLREASRLEELVSDFLRFARPPPLRRAPADLSGMLDEMLRVFAFDPAAAGVSVVKELAPTRADCDVDQIRQVAWNLVVNAAHAVQGVRPGGGTIRVSCAPDGEWVRLVVEDDGRGIPPEDLERIFMPFFTTKERGSGLGLAAVHRVVDAHGGSVSVESAPGEGARFTVRLPAHDEAAAG